MCSTSLTSGSSFFSGVDIGNGINNNLSYSRANSSSSLGSEIYEPSWFSHAFDVGIGNPCAQTLRLARRVVGVIEVLPPKAEAVDVDDPIRIEQKVENGEPKNVMVATATAAVVKAGDTVGGGGDDGNWPHDNNDTRAIGTGGGIDGAARTAMQ